MQLTLLGTGNAPGVPVYGCQCSACQRALRAPHYQRQPCSALLQVQPQSGPEQQYLLDAGLMDLAQRFPAGSLDGILLTHFHVDHVQGLFHLRWGVGDPITVYCPADEQGCADLYKHPGPLQFTPLSPFESIALGDTQVTPLPLQHSRPTLGYAIEDRHLRFAYLTDTQGLPDETLAFLEQWQAQVIVIDTSFPATAKQTFNHNNVDDSLALFQRLQPEKLVLTHIGHELDLWLMNHQTSLPEGVEVGFDGLEVVKPLHSPLTIQTSHN